jgi:hypothetical protein
MSDAQRATVWSGPVEESPWPTQVRGHVVDPTGPARIHGYDVTGDLARHYGFAAVVFLSLTGELPNEPVERAFEHLLVCAAPVSVREAPAHAAGLARLVGATSSSVMQVGAVALAERAWFNVSRHKRLLEWLAAPAGPIPAAAIESNDRDRVAALRELMRRAALDVPALAHDLAWEAAILACLHACGLRELHQFEAVWVVAGFASVAAEAHAWPRGRFREYPMNTPALRYEGGSR